MTGFEPAASCSQSKRSTKLSHIREQWDYTTYLEKKQSQKERKRTGTFNILRTSTVMPLGMGDFSMQFHIYLQYEIAPIGEI